MIDGGADLVHDGRLVIPVRLERLKAEEIEGTGDLRLVSGNGETGGSYQRLMF